ncbi:hypothetical protein AMD24_00578 [Candidatus Xiphinematobacter sp. Idaho Grape]|nr:hypothetical protein AMD24_00578 [Candidatus Xiphinematobacter sp. Idaho Grape]
MQLYRLSCPGRRSFSNRRNEPFPFFLQHRDSLRLKILGRLLLSPPNRRLGVRCVDATAVPLLLNLGIGGCTV